MGQVVVVDGFGKIGCKDPIAINYDPTATQSCANCCIYDDGKEVIGCIDPLASNYDPQATTNCSDCCVYGDGVEILDLGFNGFVGFGDIDTTDDCTGPFTITPNGEVLGVSSANCCDSFVIGGTPPPDGYDYYWTGKNCLFRETCPADIICIDCDSFDWWNDTYISTHNGQSLQETTPLLWQQLVDLVSNSGQTFYVQTTTGDLIDEICCVSKGTFRDGVCFCEVIEETLEPRCISNLIEFYELISTAEGYTFFVNNFQSIGPSLGLTNQQSNFIIANLNPNNTSTNASSAALILSNALSVTGGFYINFGSITNTPNVVNRGTCDTIGGYWFTLNTVTGPLNNGSSNIENRGVQININPIFNISIDGQCLCKPIVDQCDIDITDVETTNTTDFYNNPIQIVTQNGTAISEACCNRLIKDYNLPWSWQNPFCYTTPYEDCLPAVFSFNEEPANVPACESDLELSMWVYFGKPENPCQPIPDPPDSDIIVIDGVVCDIELSPNSGDIITDPNDNGFGDIGFGGDIVFNLDAEGKTTATPKTCCYNTENPILARITTTNPILNPFLTQINEYNSSTDFFDRWIEIKATLPATGVTLTFGLNLEIYQGLNCCCVYDIFVDDMRINCATEEPILIVNDIKCPGFDLTRVIDNKKSWVYNPGLPEVGISEYDNIERGDGSFGMLNGEGTINRTFAPSLDADIPWRYTDYFKQSSVYEKHSSLVLNTKELGLTFDMCADCPISGSTLGCPDGYTLSGGTNVCYDMSGTTSAITITTITYLNLYDLENYKKTFQSFWIPFMEQFIPATTIWVAGERWCNEPCTIIDPCDYDFELTDAEISINPIPDGFFPDLPKDNDVSTTDVPETLESETPTTPPSGEIPIDPPNLLLLTDLGLVTKTPLIPSDKDINIDLQAYRSKFREEITIVEEVTTP